jgi:hypothetical protein
LLLVAEIDCAVGVGGKELLTARLRRPDGFRGTPIFADDRGSPFPLPNNALLPDHFGGDVDDLSPCSIYPDPLEPSGRVFVLKVTDFSRCGVLKRDVSIDAVYTIRVSSQSRQQLIFGFQGFINVRIWFPQLAGVVMLSDQEVIIMCKPPQSTVTQSKTAGFAGTM